LSGPEARKLNAFLSATRQISNSNVRFGNGEITPKVTEVVKNIKHTNGPTLVYSNYLKSGIYPIARELDKDSIPYGVFTGELDQNKKQQLVNDYNSGKLRALLVSSSGGEGLDLKGTRAVHIMEPHWNNPKLDQVVGRAVRYRSHSKLPEEERNVNVYKYVSVFPAEKTLLSEIGLSTAQSNRNTADEYLYNVSNTKAKINRLFLNLLKQEGSKKS
jgi:SNF2 family DNA or RNA helicase